MDRQAVYSWIRRNWLDLQKDSIVRTNAILNSITAEQVCERFLKGGEEYGYFNINAINAKEELLNEYLDIPSYIAIATLQDK